jgi:hypothetical protein
VTNLTLNSKGFLRLQNIVNTNAAGVISNIIVQAATKQPGWR